MNDKERREAVEEFLEHLARRGYALGRSNGLTAGFGTESYEVLATFGQGTYDRLIAEWLRYRVPTPDNEGVPS